MSATNGRRLMELKGTPERVVTAPSKPCILVLLVSGDPTQLAWLISSSSNCFLVIITSVLKHTYFGKIA